MVNVSATKDFLNTIPLLQNYGECDSYEESFVKLEKFLVIPDSLELSNEEELNKATTFFSEIISKWNQISDKNRTWVYKILNLLIIGNRELICVDAVAKRVYTHLVNLYVQSEIIIQAIAHTSVFITPARFLGEVNSEKLITARSVIRFAIKFFGDLNPREQNSLRNLHCLALTCKEGYVDEQDKRNYNTLVEIFKNFNPDAQIRRKVALVPGEVMPVAPKGVSKPVAPRAPSPEGFVLMTIPQSDTMHLFVNEADQKKSEQIKDKQIDKICSILEPTIRLYMAPMISSIMDIKIRETFLTQLLEEFKACSKSLFLHPPSKPTIRQKKYVDEFLRSIIAVVGFYNGLKLYEKDSKANLELQTACLIKEVENSRSSIINELQRTISDIVKLALKDKGEIPEFCCTGIGILCVELLEKYLTPSLIGFLLDKFLQENEKHELKMDLDTLEGPKPTLGTYRIFADEFYSTVYGDLIITIIEAVMKLGNLSGAPKLVTQVLGLAKEIGLLSNHLIVDKMAVGEMVQAFLAKLAASECSMLPFLVIKHLTFDGELMPLKIYFAMKPEERDVYTRESYKYFNILFLNRLIKKIGFLSKVIPSLTDFCETLCKRLWQITQSQPLLLKTVLEILKGVKRGMVRHL